MTAGRGDGVAGVDDGVEDSVRCVGSELMGCGNGAIQPMTAAENSIAGNAARNLIRR